MNSSIYGCVVDSEGVPVQGAAVFIAGGPAAVPDIAAESEADGKFSFDGLPPGTWKVRANASEGRSGRAFVEVTGDTDAKLSITLQGVAGKACGLHSVE